MTLQPLQNKTIVVIGGTTGMGLSAVRACIDEGGRVVAVGRNHDHCEQVRTEFPQVVVVAGDASDPTTAPSAIETALTRFGSFDGLYHVAGGSGRRFGDGPLHEVSEDGWRQTIDWNLQSVFHSNRAALRHWMNVGSPGVILNMSSVLAVAPSPVHFATHAYATAKAGIVGMTRTVAAYYARYNIRCNAIAPALVDTPMAQRAVGDDAIMKYVRSKQPLDGGRVGQPSDLDAAVVFLLSDDSRFVTGQVLAVDGGWSVSEGKYE